MSLGHIVAIGGGGFSMPPHDPALDDAALALTGVAQPRVCFLGTAGGDAQGELDAFYAAFPPHRARASHLSLFRRRRADLASRILDCDLLYLGGGNTANLLAIWRTHGVEVQVRQAWSQGVVICGVSAGACVLFEACLTDAFGPALTPLSDGLGLIPGSFCPHYGRGRRRRPRFRQVIGEGLVAGYGVEDGAALHFHGLELQGVLRVRPDAGAYRVARVEGRVREVPL